MDQMIQEISVIEKTSEGIMEGANSKKQEIAKQIQNETKEFDQQLEAETSEQIEKLKAVQEAALEKELDKLHTQTQQALKHLKQHYEQRHKDYVKQLFKEMTER